MSASFANHGMKNAYQHEKNGIRSLFFTMHKNQFKMNQRLNTTLETAGENSLKLFFKKIYFYVCVSVCVCACVYTDQ